MAVSPFSLNVDQIGQDCALDDVINGANVNFLLVHDCDNLPIDALAVFADSSILSASKVGSVSSITDGVSLASLDYVHMLTTILVLLGCIPEQSLP